MINREGYHRDIVAVGASAGGVIALRALLAALPGDFPAAILVVLHRSPHYQGSLPAVLTRQARIPAVEPKGDERIKPGLIYIAPRDQHLVVEDGSIRVNRGPKEHHTRPAVDPLFTSAAQTYRHRVVGVLLSGGGADGVSGLIAIKQAGGVTIAQDPSEAEHPAMPRNAIRYDHLDAVLALEAIAEALVVLAHGGQLEAPPPKRPAGQRR